MKIIAAALALLLATQVAQSNPLPSTVGLHLVSAHSNTAQDWNNRNPGIYTRWGEIGTGGPVAGTYYNSERRQSVYAGYLMETQGGTFAVTAGLVTGYGTATVALLLAGSVRLAITEKTAIRFHLAPKPPRYAAGAAAIHLSIEKKL